MADGRAAVPGVDESVLAEVGRDLLCRWREPHRRYHGPAHLVEVLTALDALCRDGCVAAGPRSVAVLGAWFHDAVHAVDGAADNERRSADLAERALREMGADPDLVGGVVTAVLDTAGHDLGGVEDPARTALHDADLWVLAAPTPRFDEYCRQVRAEYAHVPAPQYAAARSAVLRPFLARDHVYRTALARSTWEPAARENLARELTRLAG